MTSEPLLLVPKLTAPPLSEEAILRTGAAAARFRESLHCWRRLADGAIEYFPRKHCPKDRFNGTGLTMFAFCDFRSSEGATTVRPLKMVRLELEAHNAIF